jgi:hypothetical protein
MSNLSEPQRQLLKHLGDGGLVATCIYGKRTMTVEVTSRPNCWAAGIRSIELLRKDGLVRDGDPSPYKSGRSIPVVLTDAGRLALEKVA